MKKLYLLIGAVVGALVGFGLLFAWIVESGVETQAQLDLAMRLLEDGRWDIAGRIARDLDESQAVDREADAGWHFVLGVSQFQSVAEDLDSPRNRRTMHEATAHLKKAETIGFPLGLHGKGKFYLGSCYFNTYNWKAAAEALADMEKLWPERRSDAYKMIVEAYLRDQPPHHAEAESRLADWSRIPGLSKRESAKIHLAQAQIEFSRKDFTTCESMLTSIDAETPEFTSGLLWRGRWRVEQAEQRPESDALRAIWLREAADVIRETMLSSETPAELARQAAYLSGKVSRLQGNVTEALGTFSSVRQRSPQSAEAIAAALEEAEILLAAESLDEAVSTCHILLRNIEDLDLYNGFWLPVEDLRKRLLDIGRTLRRDGHYDQVIQLSDHLAAAFPLSDSVRLQAETLEQWAMDLQQLPPNDVPADALNNRARVRSKYGAAAMQFEQLARLELKSSEYPEILWRSIENYQNSNDLDSANRLLKDYLRFEEHAKRPRGYLAAGKNYMQAAQWQQAIAPLERCLDEYPGHPILYEVRLLAAKTQMEMGDLESATEMLESNLWDYKLEPTSDVWRDSMFQLGHTLFKRGNRLLLEMRTADALGEPVADRQQRIETSQQHFVDAVERLGHAVTRYDHDPRLYDARYMMAKSHQVAADTYDQVAASKNGAVVESGRRQLMYQKRALLERALVEFSELRTAITEKGWLSNDSDRYASLVRNCYFGEADTLYALGRWDDAVLAYRSAAGRYMNQPESLEALVQMANCHRKRGTISEAQKTLLQAEQVLSRIPTEYDDQFVVLTRASRAGWKTLLAQLKKWD